MDQSQPGSTGNPLLGQGGISGREKKSFRGAAGWEGVSGGYANPQSVRWGGASPREEHVSSAPSSPQSWSSECSQIRSPFLAGQAVPAGSHVRLNLQTGEREAKLPDRENGESETREERRRKR